MFRPPMLRYPILREIHRNQSIHYTMPLAPAIVIARSLGNSCVSLRAPGFFWVVMMGVTYVK